MRNNLSIITNNPSVWENYKESMNVEFVEGKYMDVLISVRNKIHLGYKLITHPLMGSVKPNETPYRSIIIEAGSGTDMQSVTVIESSIQACEKFLNNKPLPDWNEKVLKDFQFVDIRLIESALSSL